ncbi:hypothetical protein F862_gp019 [Vibrio phage vB_VpaS_MAR10]|uniref:Uncharacterized protein n=1 Tax=Vibrio phage vB_VpaS_MAR10 TaxID=1229755 RepID=K7R6A7_9CAUD|nr:hypothetical protein F862_gp019 [Vibrio phage vB_VpaS_MAR10]AFV81251.1 hypothetical protein MAR10_019 [Vibrio phage vB_VpaS_MAR10]
MRKEVSCFSKGGKLTREMKVILDVATTIELALVNNSDKEPLVVMVQTARRLKQSPRYRKQWAQSIVNKYLHADARVLQAHRDTVDSLFALRDAGYKTY